MQVGLLSLPTNESAQKSKSTVLYEQFKWEASSDQIGENYYRRIYIDVWQEGSRIKIKYLIRFVK